MDFRSALTNGYRAAPRARPKKCQYRTSGTKLELSLYGRRPVSLPSTRARRSDPAAPCPDANSTAAALQCLFTLVQQRGNQHLQFRRLRAVDAGNDRVGHHQRLLTRLAQPAVTSLILRRCHPPQDCKSGTETEPAA